MAIELTVIVPCLNEEANVPELVKRVIRVFDVGGLDGELVVVDDGSTDGTRAAIEDAMAANPGRVRGVFHHENTGIAAAWRSGVAEARGKLCAIIDADLQYQPEDLLRLRHALYERSVDVVQGWRSAVGREKGPRWYYSRGFNALLNGVFSMDMKDNKSGFLICAREVLEDLLTYRGSYFYWQSFIMVAAKAKGYSYHQIETLFMNRMAGTSFLETRALSVSAKCLVDLARAAWEYRLARRPPDVAQPFLRRRAAPPIPASHDDALQRARFKTYLAAFNVSHHMITRDVGHYHQTLRQTEWLDASDLGALQDEKLRRLIRHAYRSVPHYRGVMQARGLSPEDIRSRGDLSALPLISRADIARHLYFDILSEDHDKANVRELPSCGSSGEPLPFFLDRKQLELRWAAALRMREATGYRFGDPRLSLWRSHEDGALDAVLANAHVAPVEALDERSLSTLRRRVATLSPRLIEGSSEVVEFFAHQLLIGPPLDASVDAVLVSGQLPSADAAELVRRAFGAELYAAYGLRELGEVAHECNAHDGLHVIGERVIVEVVDGEIVVTDLSNDCMPLIRYRTGDRGEWIGEPCVCGRGSPRLRILGGRAVGYVEARDGRCLPAGWFSDYFAPLRHAVEQYRIAQRRRGAVDVHVVRSGRYDQRLPASLRASIHRHLGDALDVHIVEHPPGSQLDGPTVDVSERTEDARQA